MNLEDTDPPLHTTSPTPLTDHVQRSTFGLPDDVIKFYLKHARSLELKIHRLKSAGDELVTQLDIAKEGATKLTLDNSNSVISQWHSLTKDIV